MEYVISMIDSMYFARLEDAVRFLNIGTRSGVDVAEMVHELVDPVWRHGECVGYTLRYTVDETWERINERFGE